MTLLARFSRGTPALAAVLAACSAVAESPAVSPSDLARSPSLQECLAGADVQDVAEVHALRILAFRPEPHTEGVRSAVRYLERLADLGRGEKDGIRRPACFDAGEKDLGRLGDLHCAEGGQLEDEQQCLWLAELEIDTQTLRTHCWVTTLDDPNHVRAYEELARSLLALWTRLGEPRIRRGRPLPRNMPQPVAEAMTSFRMAHDEAGVAEARAIATEPKNGLSSRELDHALLHLAR
jgi:hypothetical protein